MKLKLLMILVVLILIVGCGETQVTQESTETEEQPTVTELEVNPKAIMAAVINDPDNAVSRCEEIPKTDEKQICYSTYMAVKADKQESFDVSICKKVKPENEDNCNLYLAALKTMK
ncbi:hypothetical protein ACFL0W_05415 [Nanoarchaeota archaeon]